MTSSTVTRARLRDELHGKPGALDCSPMRQDRAMRIPRRNTGNGLVSRATQTTRQGIAPQDLSRSITIASPDIAANNTASNTAIVTVSCFLHVMALVIFGRAGRIRCGGGSSRAYAKDDQSTQSTQDCGLHGVSPFPALLAYPGNSLAKPQLFRATPDSNT